jgi:cytochrome b pre-mRNA-processing protein 3
MESGLALLSRLFGEKKQRARLDPLYGAVVAAGRTPSWYVAGGVPDSIEGRFDMIASLLALVLLRLEREGGQGKTDSVLLTEIFIEDMDGSLRQIGIGDFTVGKHIGRLMGALGGRLQAFREALEAGGDLEAEARRNIFRDSSPESGSLAFVARGLKAFARGLDERDREQLLQGDIPAP